METLKCPKCGRRIHETCLTSNPVMYEIGCGWCGFQLRYWDRQNDTVWITQEEINDYYKAKGNGGIA